VPYPEVPDLAALRRTAAVFTGFANVDTTWLRLLRDTRGGIDLSRSGHRELMLRWLNSWGCRIRYPRPGEPAPFDTGTAAWWRAWHGTLPAGPLARLTDAEIEAVGAAYAALAGTPVSAGPIRRTLGPTAAAKALYALRPEAVMPWDAAIAATLHGARDGAAFARHQRLGRAWAAAVVAEAGGDADTVPALVGRPGIALAKILDEYLYVTITMPGPAA